MTETSQVVATFPVVASTAKSKNNGPLKFLEWLALEAKTPEGLSIVKVMENTGDQKRTYPYCLVASDQTLYHLSKNGVATKCADEKNTPEINFLGEYLSSYLFSKKLHPHQDSHAKNCIRDISSILDHFLMFAIGISKSSPQYKDKKKYFYKMGHQIIIFRYQRLNFPFALYLKKNTDGSISLSRSVSF